ncbi:FAD-binding oxidoreductase [Polyangium sp. 15x6]|uniref:FAD-binding oxidoreductase n=1 Tax=Polyangium sp. 15x6 TaxID=3042687 RepID=UPI002499C7B7|nr:FAD-binding oxidoreductase [Polyangium sp. 15x6]MDI3287052.1 FAD-binding oxidoreductase [Polyangium sp. 15x6]
MPDIQAALTAFRRAIGDEHVRTDETTLTAVQRATFATTQSAPAVLRPANREEVQACVRIANEHKIALYPISTGKNWGYGSSVPARDGSMILDLGRLNRIVDFSEELAYITVEPGVTMQQVYEHLKARGSKRMVSVTGSAPHTSLIGNVCDRGIGAGINSDRAANICDLEVVLPTGELVRTGFGRFAGAKTARVYRWGVGPYLDGLFTQSNLGVVTQMTFWLAPVPEHYEVFFFRIHDESRLAGVVDAIRELKLRGIPRTSIALWNDYKLLSGRQQYPWEEAGGQTPLPHALLERMRRKWGGGIWLGGGAIFASTKEQVKAERDAIRRALVGRVDKLTFLDRTAATVARALRAPVARLTGFDLGQIVEAYEATPHLGIPMPHNIRSAYWRKRSPAPADLDPDRDRCGAIWFSPAVPATGADLAVAAEAIKRGALAHRFEPNIAMILSAERCVNIVAALVYDRETKGEDERAMACYRELFRSFTEQGYYPYRLGLQSMESLPASQGGYGKLMNALKRALDPNDILSPGRYDFRHEWPDGGA